MKTIAFFNNKGGVGKTSLVYHLAWMFAEMRCRVVAADLDPQANLTSMFLDEGALEDLWESGEGTIFGAIAPLLRGVGDIGAPSWQTPSENIRLVPGHLALSRFEDDLSAQWPQCLDGQERAFRVTTAFSRIIERAAKGFNADLALIDVGPNLGAVNRAAMIASDSVVIPLSPDLFSLQGLRNMGPTLLNWRQGWKERKSGWEERESKNPNPDSAFPLPQGEMMPVGYVVMRHSVRYERPVKAYARWIDQIPGEYRKSILDEPSNDVPIDDDDHCLAQLKDYRSLMPMAQESNKPMFLLKPADGAIGGHQGAVQACYDDFLDLAKIIDDRTTRQQM